MKFLIIAGLIFLFLASPCFRCAIFNPWQTVKNACVDAVHFFKYKEWNVASSGSLICYIGLFGKGKTLSCVHKVCSLYRQFNQKKVYDKFRSKWVTQQIVILSNVHLNNVPYILFDSLKQVVEYSHKFKELDEANDTITYLYVIGDEFSVQMNSRNFKSNIDAQFLNSLLTCRHYHISIFYTAQRFNHVDALLRQVTQTVISCDKLWRFQRQNSYDAYELENCTNPLLVQPLSRSAWFVTNFAYSEYDTLACVDNLAHSALNGDMLTEEEILKLQAPENSDTVVRYSRKASRRKPSKKGGLLK